MAKLRHIAIACKDPDVMADFYIKAFDFKNVRTSDGPLAYGHHLSDGTIDLAILRFKSDQIGKGMDYTGLHHFGILVEDVDKAAKQVEALGGKHYMDQADAERVKLQAEAAASHQRIALDRMLIEQLPQIVKEAAAGLSGANLSVLNGADGLSEIAAGLVAQGLTILDSVKKSLNEPGELAGTSAITSFDRPDTSSGGAVAQNGEEATT